MNDVEMVPYEMLTPGFEAVYTGETIPTGNTHCRNEGLFRFEADAEGRVLKRWSPWTWTWAPGMHLPKPEWNDEIRYINNLQASLGPLSDSVRRIRAHIGSLVPCDMGFPVTVDQLLSAIGAGELTEPFHNGCWAPAVCAKERSTQPDGPQTWSAIEKILKDYLNGDPQERAIERFPYARGFIRRTYAWLGPVDQLSKVQLLLLEFVLLPFPLFTFDGTLSDESRGERWEKVFQQNLRGGRGAEIVAEIAAEVGLPELKEELFSAVEDEKVRALLNPVWVSISDMYHDGCNCHHSAFRWTEAWIHGIGTGSILPPTRKKGTERDRLGHALFGYVLGLDRWLQDVPMHFLLLDMGHIDLGFDARNEILRVYAYLGETTPVKAWLAACLWHNLTYNSIFGNPGGLVRHPGLLKRAGENGISLREWIDSRLQDGAGASAAED
jgi:hypothetical protein